MGLLFVIEGDENATGIHVDMLMDIHNSILLATKNIKNSSFPLVRRINRFYSDALYESDEIESLIEELHIISKETQLNVIGELIKLCSQAKKQNLGIETIAD